MEMTEKPPTHLYGESKEKEGILNRLRVVNERIKKMEDDGFLTKKADVIKADLRGEEFNELVAGLLGEFDIEFGPKGWVEYNDPESKIEDVEEMEMKIVKDSADEEFKKQYMEWRKLHSYKERFESIVYSSDPIAKYI